MAIVPTKIKLDAGGDKVAIEWADGHSSAYDYESLRGLCPCAVCKGAGNNAVEKKTGVLPMFKPKARPLRAELVGRYALQIFWSDGHSAGIYTFSYLREACPCGECRRAREDTTL